MNETYLIHHGVKGQRWGVRRYRNEDGSLTPAGKKHEAKLEKWRQSELTKVDKAYGKAETSASKKEQRASDKFEKAVNSGKASKAELNELYAEVVTAKLHKYEVTAKRAAEIKALTNMTMDELESDRRAVRRLRAGRAVATTLLGVATLAAPVSAPVKATGIALSLAATPMSAFSSGYDARISKNQDREIVTGAMRKAGATYYSRGNRTYTID